MSNHSDYFSYPRLPPSNGIESSASFAAPPIREAISQFIPGPYPAYHPPTPSGHNQLPPMITSEPLPPVFIPLSQISPYPSPELSAWDSARIAAAEGGYAPPPPPPGLSNHQQQQWAPAYNSNKKQEQEERYHQQHSHQHQPQQLQQQQHQSMHHLHQQEHAEHQHHQRRLSDGLSDEHQHRFHDDDRPGMPRANSFTQFPQQQLAYPREEPGAEKKAHAPSKPFPAKLAFLLQHPDLYSDVIRWNYEGTSFVISLIDRLIIEVLPQLFFHQSMAAFTRQLNTYGFTHLTNTDVIAQFHPSSTTPKSLKSLSGWSHPLFTRDNPATLHLLAPKPSRARELQQQVRTAFLEKERSRVGGGRSAGRRDF